ncbi:MAG: DUF5668 domain-containing protein [Ignavibacteriales bacterium]
MKTGQIFWGIFFLVFGSLFLLSKYDLLVVNWSFAWDLWPLLLIFWGLSIITKDSKAKPFISAAFGIIIAVLLFGMISNIFEHNSDDNISWSDTGNTNYFSQEWNKSIENAHLEIHAGGGKFVISDITDKLIEGKAKGIFSNSSLEFDTSGNVANLLYELDDENIKIFPKDKLNNYLDVQLNPKPVWDIDLELGAAKLNCDFSKYKVASLNLESGATSSKLKFGNLQKEVNIKIEMGAAKLTILVPKDFGCKIDGDMVLVAKNFSGFKKSDNFYITDGFEKADGKINIKIDGGVSSIDVERY